MFAPWTRAGVLYSGGSSKIEYPTTLVRGRSCHEHSRMTQLAAHAFFLPLAAADFLRPSMLYRSVSRPGLREAISGSSTTTASGFPGPSRVIEAFLGSLRLVSALPSFTLPE